MEQLADRRHGVQLLQRAMAVRSEVAQVFNQLGLGENLRAGRVLERWLVDQRAQIVLVRNFEGEVVAVEPRHGKFERPACIEAGGARVGDDQGLSLLRVGCQLRPLGL